MAEIMTVWIEGVSPILMNNPARMRASADSGLSVMGGNVPLPEEEAAGSRYLSADGRFLEVPTQPFKGAWVNGSKGRKIGKGAATSILKWAVFCAEPSCVLLDKDTHEPIPPDRYEIDTRRVILRDRNGKSIGVVRARAKVSNWCCKLPFEVDEFVSDQRKALIELFNLGGRAAGVFDYRPQKGGPFGRFQVSLAEETVNGKQKPREREGRHAKV